VSEAFVLIGHPVAHSLSPAIHRAAYRALGLSGPSYEAVDCPSPDDVRHQIQRVRRGDIAGANVTVPWKRLVLELVDQVDASARDTGAANVLTPTGTNGACRIVASNTDVPALTEELRSGRPSARAATVIGNGGAALAAVVACRNLGIERITAVARGFRGPSPAEWPGADALRARGATPVEWPSDAATRSAFAEAVRQSDVIVQSTSDGMHGASDGSTVRDLVPWQEVPRDAFVYDVVYNPAVTPFVASARAAGLHAESGLGMLVGQAIAAIERWLGQRPDAKPLREAAERALSENTKR
jgi:shikimate dehydrogenase